jgi:hypothetical protein
VKVYSFHHQTYYKASINLEAFFIVSINTF